MKSFQIYRSAGLGKPEPLHYSVISSEYDCENDFMCVFAPLDENKNGQRDKPEKVHVFWINLKFPKNNGRQYE